eukprot:SAG31_NODE_30683_length_377_cov_1.201439_1_plen_62_part_10
MDKIAAAVGVLLALCTTYFAYEATRHENKLFMWIFFSLATFEPAYVIFQMIKLAVNKDDYPH